MPTSLEALKLGLVDELSPAHKLHSAAEVAMEGMLKSAPDFSRAVRCPGGGGGIAELLAREG